MIRASPVKKGNRDDQLLHIIKNPQLKEFPNKNLILEEKLQSHIHN